MRCASPHISLIQMVFAFMDDLLMISRNGLNFSSEKCCWNQPPVWVSWHGKFNFLCQHNCAGCVRGGEKADRSLFLISIRVLQSYWKCLVSESEKSSVPDYSIHSLTWQAPHTLTSYTCTLRVRYLTWQEPHILTTRTTVHMYMHSLQSSMFYRAGICTVGVMLSSLTNVSENTSSHPCLSSLINCLHYAKKLP